MTNPNAALMRRQMQQPTFANPSPMVSSNRAFYTYAARFTAVPSAGASSPVQSITIDNDADFDWMYSTYMATIGDVAQTLGTELIPIALVDIATQDTQRMSNLPVPIPSVFGDGRQPLVLPTARRLARRTQIQFTVTNLGADNINLWLMLIGQKVFS
jgi:hypothetical protein